MGDVVKHYLMMMMLTMMMLPLHWSNIKLCTDFMERFILASSNMVLQSIGGSIVKHNKLKQWGFHCIVNLGIVLFFNIIYDAKVLSVLLNGRNDDNTDMQ